MSSATRGRRLALHLLPAWLRHYRRADLPRDLLAGLIVAALAVPMALGYAGIAGVPVLVGLYCIPLALIAYAFIGTSPQLVVGPVSTVAVLSGSLVVDMADGDPSRTVALTAALALGAGVGLVIGGLARLGWAAEFMSRPIVTGFVFGLTLLIIIGEIPHLLGIESGGSDVPERVWGIATNLGEIQPLTAVLGVAALVILFAGNHWAHQIPWGLMVLVGSIVLSATMGLDDRGVAVVGPVPSGMIPFGLPAVGIEDIPDIVFAGLAMALVGVAEGLGAARLFAAKDGITLNTNRELIGMGAANIASGLSGGMGVAGSLSKTASARAAGSRTQMTGITVAVLVLGVILVLAPLLAPLPRTVLSAIVIQAVWGLMDGKALVRYASIRRNDGMAALSAMIGVLLLGPLYGLLAAIAIALLGLVYRSTRGDLDVMGKVPNEKAAWGSITDHPERRTIDGIVVLRLDAPLFWANASHTYEVVMAEIAEFPDAQAVLLDLEATSQLDATSIDTLDLLFTRLRERGIDLYLVRVFYEARRALQRAGFVDRLGRDHMWHSISAGVKAARAATGIDADPHPQEVDEDSPDGERIAVQPDRDDPGGGYIDHHRGRPWWDPRR